MTNEEKQLLLKDLSARLPYGVKAQLTELDDNDGSEYYTECRITGVKDNQLINFIRIMNGKEIGRDQWFDVSFFKPYLYPIPDIQNPLLSELNDLIANKPFYEITSIAQDWYNKHHFDYRCLIEKGLALKAPDSMYK